MSRKSSAHIKGWRTQELPTQKVKSQVQKTCKSCLGHSILSFFFRGSDFVRRSWAAQEEILLWSCPSSFLLAEVGGANSEPLRSFLFAASVLCFLLPTPGTSSPSVSLSLFPLLNSSLIGPFAMWESRVSKLRSCAAECWS